MTTTTPKPPQPQEILKAKQAELKMALRISQERLNNHASYMRENAGSLMLSGVSFLLSSSKGEKKTAKKNGAANMPVEVENPAPARSLSLLDYLSVGKSMLPVVWEIAQPLAISWGFRIVRRLAANAFSRKKKR